MRRISIGIIGNVPPPVSFAIFCASQSAGLWPSLAQLKRHLQGDRSGGIPLIYYVTNSDPYSINHLAVAYQMLKAYLIA